MLTSTLVKPLTTPEEQKRLHPLPAAPPTLFLASSELGRQLQRLEQAQAEIDRRKVQELARLGELQNRD